MAIELTTVPIDTIDINNDLMWFQNVSATPDDLNALTPASLLGANLVDIRGLTDPNADSIPFWDDSAGHIVWLSIGSGLSITGTTIAATGGGGGSPGGSSTQVQFNNAGAFGGSANFVWDDANSKLTLTASGATKTPAVVKAAASQSANLFEVQPNASSTPLAWFDSNGYLGIGGASGNSSLMAYNMSVGQAYWTVNTTQAFAIHQNNSSIMTIASWQFGWVSSGGVAGASIDTGLKRKIAKFCGPTDGSTGGGGLWLKEMTAPAAPAADEVYIYAQDNGAGKTQIMALFSSGAAQQLAIQP